ncbi:hypothetical protein RND71_037360 [Anisodus tanguticus]|uniref:Auxin-responsive protein n=1 Tax=Anisodus tanguticus TaxID=243964 RepID=A0AAE1R390_9SOLA|nr:hypothetical protein RND71_037360 [Anisodus tanguticus]
MDNKDLNFKATKLRLGLPGSESPPLGVLKNFPSGAKRGFFDTINGNSAQVVGWPPIRSFRKNMVSNPPKTEENAGCHYVKVSMDGAPYLRKVDLTIYNSYKDLSSALEKMFSDGLNESNLADLLHGSEYVFTYEDKDGDWMLVGDVPWEMFTESCKKLRVMKSSDANGLGNYMLLTLD